MGTLDGAGEPEEGFGFVPLFGRGAGRGGAVDGVVVVGAIDIITAVSPVLRAGTAPGLVVASSRVCVRVLTSPLHRLVRDRRAVSGTLSASAYSGASACPAVWYM